MREVDYALLPPHVRRVMKDYVDHGIVPGPALTAMLADRFTGFVQAGDINLIQNADRCAQWLREECPPDAWGSYLSIREWQAKGGLLEMRSAREPVLRAADLPSEQPEDEHAAD